MKRIISIILGILMYLAILISFSDFDNVKVELIIIISCSLLMVGIAATIIWGLEYFAQFYISMAFTNLVLAIASPFLIIGVKVYMHNHYKVSEAATKKTETILLHCDSLKCDEIKYGTFVHHYDTIKRIHTDSCDLEIVKNIGYHSDTCIIRWFNSCNYDKLSIRNKQLIDLVKVGNIDSDSCIFYYYSGARMMFNNGQGDIIKVKILKSDKRMVNGTK
jgi:hypothetical protein